MSELSQLKWQCRRGMKELDLVLTHYLEHQYLLASPQEQQTFKEWLELSDIDLYSYLIGQMVPTTENLSRLIEKMGMGA